MPNLDWVASAAAQQVGASRSTMVVQSPSAVATQVAGAAATHREHLWEEAYRAYLEEATHRVA